MTNFEKWSRIIRYFWPHHSKLSILRACQGLVATISFINGSELFLEAYFMQAEHEDISWVISLVMPGQKIDCLYLGFVHTHMCSM